MAPPILLEADDGSQVVVKLCFSLQLCCVASKLASQD
jgi:hypothetical protein